jgi:hypothetical protein
MKKFIKNSINSTLSLLGYEIQKLGGDRYPGVPIEASKAERALMEECGKYSMTGNIRMWALIQSIRHVIANGIEGDFVECGVWKGGSLALMSKLLDIAGEKRSVIGFDTFDGMSEPTQFDVDLFGNRAQDSMALQIKDEKIHNIHAFAGIEQVKSNLNSLNADRGVRLICGKVEDTLMRNENLPEKIAILRLDTDWYESTKIELDLLYPRLSSGGVLIVDDFGHFEGARRAVEEYFLNQTTWFHYVDYTCRLLIKP